VASIILARENWIYVLIMLLAAIPAAIVSAHYTKALYALSLEQLNNERQLSYFQTLAIDRRYAQDLRLYNVGERLKQKYRSLWQLLFDQRRDKIKKKTFQTILITILPEVVIVGIGFSVAKDILASRATIGDYALLTGLVSQLWGGVSQFTASLIQVLDNKLRIDTMRSYEAITNRIQDSGSLKLKKVESIYFENVSFRYPGTDKLVLEEVSFNVKLGEKVAIVGINGSGKTTLIKLLLRMYEPDMGVIKVNEIDIKSYSLESLRRNFSVYFQDMENFSFSIRDNFSMTDETHPDSERCLNQSLKDVDLCETVSCAGNGLDTYLNKYFSEKGIELSGGQHQKLALARTLFRRNTAVVLDEPSSNLDPKLSMTFLKSSRSIQRTRSPCSLLIVCRMCT
jgi:ABC-type multidrug transport system fused ATPase/permease subunit